MSIEYITKPLHKLYKQLLNVASKDTSREILTCIKVDKNSRTMSAANGFMMMVARLPELVEDVKDTGNYKVKLGNVGKEPVIDIEAYLSTNIYPDLSQVMRPKGTPPLVEINIDARLLRHLIDQADGLITIYIYNIDEKDKTIKTPLEMHFTVEGYPVHAALMPMHRNTDDKPWSAAVERLLEKAGTKP